MIELPRGQVHGRTELAFPPLKYKWVHLSRICKKRSRINNHNPRAYKQANVNTMPPRLPALSAYCRAVPTKKPIVSFLLPIFQARHASILNTLSDNPGAYNRRIRVGRGASSGKGKTSGRGHKGQKARGKTPTRFQGGQTSDEEVHGYRGFVNKYGFDF